jgi:prepilin-type N-terminal cleavage/methylation domain-containing protein
MNRDSARRRVPSRGFTLVELLAVIVIILLVSVLTLPIVIPSLSERQVGEAARLLQGALVGARDSAIQQNAPSGIRLVPDSMFNGINPSTGLLDPNLPLAASRIVPLGLAPDHTEGYLSIFPPPPNLKVPYQGPGGGTLPLLTSSSNCLMVEESVYQIDPNSYVALPNPPVSWFWNVRVGDKVQINRSGPWYTVVGPMTVKPADGNAEMFVNVGPPGPPVPKTYPLRRYLFTNGTFYYPEFLFLVNGRDDNHNGWRDEGWDGVDNNGDGRIDEAAEWENEKWPEPIITQVVVNQPYIIRRRPIPTSSTRGVVLPSNVVIDLTTWATTRERSRLPVDPLTGYVEIVVNPAGDIVPSSIYSVPSSFGMSSAFFHFWLAERGDVMAPTTPAAAAPLLPIAPGARPDQSNGRQIGGSYRLATLFTRSGLLTTNPNMRFDDPAAPADGVAYNPNLPFLKAQQGVWGDP